MDKNLMLSGAWNSGIAALFFLVTAAESFSKGSVFWGVVSILACAGTVADVFKFCALK